MKPRMCILGAGSWATALCKIFSEAGLEINWWFHRSEDARHFVEFKQNPRYLTDIDFKNHHIQPFSDVTEALNGCDWVLIAIPSSYVAEVLAEIQVKEFHGKKVITSVKGILPEKLQLVTDYIHDRFFVPYSDMAVIGGPCHAEEVALEKQSYLTIGSTDITFANEIKELIQSRYISADTIDELDGIEWAAVLKNVYAIACGVCHGLGYGDNFQAVLVSNSMQEMNLFLQSKSKRSFDTLASAFLGDLLVTAYSTFSRNRTFGNMVGRGYGIKAAQVELGMVAEGYHAINALHNMRQSLGISLPIAESMYTIMYQHAPVKEAITKLKLILK
jgi:glycerol-3-phosphate dehydrogenase (NAD(P)+)